MNGVVGQIFGFSTLFSSCPIAIAKYDYSVSLDFFQLKPLEMRNYELHKLLTELLKFGKTIRSGKLGISSHF
jgi:hypothetical protein